MTHYPRSVPRDRPPSSLTERERHTRTGTHTNTQRHHARTSTHALARGPSLCATKRHGVRSGDGRQCRLARRAGARACWEECQMRSMRLETRYCRAREGGERGRCLSIPVPWLRPAPLPAGATAVAGRTQDAFVRHALDAVTAAAVFGAPGRDKA